MRDPPRASHEAPQPARSCLPIRGPRPAPIGADKKYRSETVRTIASLVVGVVLGAWQEAAAQAGGGLYGGGDPMGMGGAGGGYSEFTAGAGMLRGRGGYGGFGGYGGNGDYSSGPYGIRGNKRTSRSPYAYISPSIGARAKS